VISEKREREANELIPLKAFQSSNHANDENKWGAHNAIDLDWDTQANTQSSDNSWFELTFGRMICVEKVEWLHNRRSRATWTCSDKDCSSCVGDHCKYFTLTVTTSKGASTGIHNPSSGCKHVHGDLVRLLPTGQNRKIWVSEIAVIGKKVEQPGEL
jgi:hypothetical protein